jgi:cytidylate kinase
MSLPPTHGLPEPLVIAIDGPSGAGKSTVARLLAGRLGIPYIDTGAMYRAVGLLADREQLRPPFDDADESRLGELADSHVIELVVADDETRVLVDGEDVSEQIRTPESALMASAVSAVPAVRRALVAAQRRIGLARGGVMEGRDIGSVVFPDAALKVFLTASADDRAERRRRDLLSQGIEVTAEEIKRQQHQRDLQDTSRADSPLHVARGSVVVDSSGFSLDEVVVRLISELGKSGKFRLDTNGENTVRSRNHGGLVRGRSAPIEEEAS